MGALYTSFLTPGPLKLATSTSTPFKAIHKPNGFLIAADVAGPSFPVVLLIPVPPILYTINVEDVIIRTM